MTLNRDGVIEHGEQQRPQHARAEGAAQSAEERVRTGDRAEILEFRRILDRDPERRLAEAVADTVHNDEELDQPEWRRRIHGGEEGRARARMKKPMRGDGT